MTAQFARAPHVSGRPAPPVHSAPHAALLIDFDNVTMGIRSDLTKELKNLLNSDIIKGKVAVQRAYADWRRYPQYIVPLAENSVDLIFAPAYGSSKKNATDIRLSIDALELVFTRPEIGTFILLSGDSDFSSLVLKLKEYGKYVIGVGIRESASDLLVQNCDEYYSYSALTGLTRTGDEESKQWDPWECVEIAVQRMAEHDDVMRSDRLKQVILELDPNFDEKALGFTKFNRFLQEAATRGLLHLNKLENGQFEVAPIDEDAPVPAVLAGAVSAVAPAAGGIAGEERPRTRSRRGRGGRDRDRTPRERDAIAEPVDADEAEAAPIVEPPSVKSVQISEPAPVEPAATAEVSVAPPPALSEPRAHERPARTERVARTPRSSASGKTDHAEGPLDLPAAYSLLKRATKDVSGGKTAARDSDVKRRILELHPDFNESALGFSKFSRFLRQAHDAEVINLRKLENGNYEITLPGSPAAAEASELGVARGDRGRGRGRGRGRDREGPPTRERYRRPEPQLELDQAAATTPVEKMTPKPPAPASAPAPRAAPAPAPAPAPATAAQAPSLRFRGGSRTRPGASGPPPLLPGQTLSAPAAAEPAKPAAASPKPAAVTSKPAAAARAAGPSRDDVLARLTAAKGVGRKTAEAAVDAFGAGELFKVIQNDPDRVREKLGARQAKPLIDGFGGEAATAGNGAARRTTASKSAKATKSGRAAKETEEAPAPQAVARKTTRGSRGGKGRKKTGTGK